MIWNEAVVFFCNLTIQVGCNFLVTEWLLRTKCWRKRKHLQELACLQ